jgi:hypothetical protein
LTRLLAFLHHQPVLDAAGIETRLRQRVSRTEFFGLMLAIAMLLAFTIKPVADAIGFDWENYLRAAREPNHPANEYYYPYWVLPLVWLIGLAGVEIGYFIWGVLNILGAWFAARVFGGKAILALVSYQLLYMLFYGQIVGVMLAGVALFWWGMERKRWELASIGALLGALKYQSGAPLILALWLLAGISWRERTRVLMLPIAVAIISLIIYPLWPLDILERLESKPPEASASISLWLYIGPAALIFWLPTVLLPMKFSSRMVAVAATAALAMPYFQQADLLMLTALPTGWLGIWGCLGYVLLPAFGWDGLRVLAIFPALAYLWTVGPAAWQFLQRKPTDPTQLSTNTG